MHKRQKLTIGYARVSSADHRQELGLAIQLDALRGCDQIFYDKESGASTERKELEKALALAFQAATEGRQVSLVIYKLDRLSRQMLTLLEMIEELNHRQIKLISLKEQIETDSLTGKLLCLILGYVAEMELENISLRTKEGLKKAKERGVKLGNKGLCPQKEKDIVSLYQKDQLSVRQIAQKVKVSTSTIYSVLKRQNISLKKPTPNA